MSEAFDDSGAAGKSAGRSGGKKHRAKVSALKKSKPAARAGKSATPPVAASRWKGVRFGFLLLGLCIAFGVQSAYQSQKMRALYSELQKDQVAQDALLAQRSRLLIERGAMSSYNGTEKIASEQLGMRFPERIIPTPNSGSAETAAAARGRP